MFVSSFLLRGLRGSFPCPYLSRVTLFSRRFLCSAQAIEEEDGTEVQSKRELMQEEGFTEQQIEAVLDIDPRSDKLAWLLSLLKDRGITGPTAGSFIASHSKLIHGNLDHFRLRLEILQDAGMEPSLLRKAILQRSGFLSCCASPDNLEKHLSFLKDLGLCPNTIYLAMIRSPGFLKLGIENRLKPRCELFYNRGVSKEALRQLLRNYPRVFSGSDVCIIQKLDLVEKFGLDLKTKAGARALGLWSTSSLENLLDKAKLIETVGLTHEEAVEMVKRQPSVLCMREEHIRKKIEFALHTVNSSVKEILKSPSYLTCSFEKRIVPRFAIVLALKEKGLLKKPVPLGSVVSISDKEFQKRFKT
eukprot:c18814_g1_i1 orf=23-1102(-)